MPTIAQITLFFISFLFPKNILVLNYWLLKAEPFGILGTTAERVIPACVLFVIGVVPAGGVIPACVFIVNGWCQQGTNLLWVFIRIPKMNVWVDDFDMFRHICNFLMTTDSKR